MRLEAAARAIDWESRVRAAEDHHVRKSREWESEKTNLERETGALGRDVEKFRPDHANIESLKQRLKDMREVWLNPASSEWDCQKVLARNLWVLSPDYIVGRYKMYVTGTLSMSTILEELFSISPQNSNLKGPVMGSKKPDICGLVEAHSLGPSASQSQKLLAKLGAGTTTQRPERVFLIIELKKPGISLRWKMLEQAHAYGWYLLQNVKELQKHRIECLVIGEDCEKVNDAHIRWGSGPHDAIRIVPMSYRQLYDRAEAMTQPYLEKQFGRETGTTQDSYSIAPVPEITAPGGETVASQLARQRVAPQKDLEPEDTEDGHAYLLESAPVETPDSPIPVPRPPNDLATPAA